MTPCEVCAFDPGNLTPADAVVAIRSFPRRFTELIDEAEAQQDEEAEQRVRSAAGEAAGEIEAVGRDLRAVLVQDLPAVSATASAGGGVERLAEVAAQLADLAEHQPGEAWTRTGTRGGATVTAGDLLREAVHAGVHHLRAVGG